MAYRMSGRFLEACDCYVPCPCWFEQGPDDAECTGFVAWQIENGEIDDVDVSGLSVVSVSQHGGHRDGAHHMRVALLVDDEADEDQQSALSAAFSGSLGGPLGELARLTGDLAAVEPAKITFVDDDGKARVEVPKLLGVRSKVVRGSTKRPVRVADGQLATLLGSPVTVGRSSRYRLSIEAAKLDIDVSDRSTMTGRFSYAHKG